MASITLKNSLKLHDQFCLISQICKLVHLFLDEIPSNVMQKKNKKKNKMEQILGKNIYDHCATHDTGTDAK